MLCVVEGSAFKLPPRHTPRISFGLTHPLIACSPFDHWMQIAMKRRAVGLLAGLAVLVFVPSPAVAVTATASKSCNRGTHAVVGGAHKCLARGQFCARGQDRTYHKYGFHCHKRDARGNYHLT